MPPLLKIIIGLNLLTQAILLIISIASAYTSYVGNTIIIQGDFSLKAMAALLAICCGALIYLYWTWAIKVIPELVKRRAQVLALIVVLALAVPSILGISTLSSTIGMTHVATAEHYQRDIPTRAEEAAARAQAQVTGVQLSLSSLDAFADILAAQVQAEAIGGGGGGVGCGIRCRNLGSAERSVRELADRLSAEAAALDRHFADVTALLAELRAIEGSIPDLDARGAQMADLLVRVNEVLARMDVAPLLAAMEQGLAPLPDAFVVDLPESADEQAAVDAIATMLRARTAPMIADLAALRVLPSPEPIAFEQPGPVELLIRYWRAVTLQIAIGLALDLGPFVILLLRIIAIRAIREEDPERRESRQQAWTAGDLREAKRILKSIQRDEERGEDAGKSRDTDPDDGVE